MIKVFECPFWADCHEETVVSWIENEPIEIVFPIKCRAPFLINRKTGQIICRIVIEEGKEENWIEAIDGIGRARKNDKRRTKKQIRKRKTAACTRTGRRSRV